MPLLCVTRCAHLCVHQWDELAEIFVYRGMIWNKEKAGITNKKFENQWSNPSLLPPDSTKHKSFRQTHISSTRSLWEDRFHSLLFENFSVTDIIWLFVSDLHPTCQHLCTFSLVSTGNGDHLVTTLGITGLCGTSLSLLIRYSAFTPCSHIKALKIINHSLLTLH